MLAYGNGLFFALQVVPLFDQTCYLNLVVDVLLEPLEDGDLDSAAVQHAHLQISLLLLVESTILYGIEG